METFGIKLSPPQEPQSHPTNLSPLVYLASLPLGNFRHCGVVGSQISIRRLNAERAQHRNDLAAVVARVIDDVKNNLQSRNTEFCAIRQYRQDLFG